MKQLIYVTDIHSALIFAAPDMLEALEELDACIGNGCGEDRWNEACATARAAIAKARGHALPGGGQPANRGHS